MKKTKERVRPNGYHKTLAAGLAAILIFMPFHGVISVGLGKLTGQMQIVQAWKEALMIGLIAVAAVGIIAKRLNWPPLDYVNKSALAILSLALVLTVLNPTGLKPLAFGLKTDIAPVVLFFVAQLAAPAFTKNNLLRLIVWPATIVAVIAIAQAYIIPLSLMAALGYNPSTINPLQLVDPALSLFRVFSTLGGPNQLGAYLILPISLAAVYIIKKRSWRLILPLGLMIFAVILSFSRSAWVGTIAALLFAPFLLLGKKTRIIYASLAVLAIVTSTVLVARVVQSPINTTAQYILLHGRVFEAKVEGSDTGRLDSAQESLAIVLSSPFGRGFGTAGPASFRSSSPIISENWYLQIGIEMGIVGLLAYLGFFAANGAWLYIDGQKGDLISVGLLTALIGLSIVNLFLHTWADSTLALVFLAALGVNKELAR